MRPSQILLTLVTAAIALYGVVFLYEISSGAPGCCGATWPSADPNGRLAAALMGLL